MYNKKTGDNKRIIFIFLAAAFFSLSSWNVFAADPGHSAGVIANADFESGNYSFPDSLIVNYSTFLATSGGSR